MSWTGIFGAIGGLAALASSFVFIWKWVAWKTQDTPAEVDQKIDAAEAAAKQAAEQSGRPT